MDHLDDRSAYADPALGELCRWTTSTLVPHMLRHVGATHRDVLAAHDRRRLRRTTGTAARMAAAAAALEAAEDPGDVVELIHDATAMLFIVSLDVRLPPDGRAMCDDDPEEQASTALRHAYTTMNRVADVQLMLPDGPESDDDDHNAPWQLDQRLRQLAFDAADRLGAGTLWGMEARLVAGGMEPDTAAITVIASQQ